MWTSITVAVENDTGVDVHTDFYRDDEGTVFASRVAAPFCDLGFTPVRVYAASGDLLLERAGTESHQRPGARAPAGRSARGTSASRTTGG